MLIGEPLVCYINREKNLIVPIICLQQKFDLILGPMVFTFTLEGFSRKSSFLVLGLITFARFDIVKLLSILINAQGLKFILGIITCDCTIIRTTGIRAWLGSDLC